MALSYSAVWKVPTSYTITGLSASESWDFIVGAISVANPVALLNELKTNYESLYGGTLSWTIAVVGLNTVYTISWTGLTTDPETTASPSDSIFRGNPVAVVYADDITGEGGGFQWVSEDLCQDTGNCPECPPSVNPDDATDCPDCYSDTVPFCDTPISILGLSDSTEYTFSIVDQATGLTYTYTTTTDANGQADLVTADFPTGLFTPYNGPFTISIFDTNGDPVTLTYGYVNYSCVEVTITNSNDYTP